MMFLFWSLTVILFHLPPHFRLSLTNLYYLFYHPLFAILSSILFITLFHLFSLVSHFHSLCHYHSVNRFPFLFIALYFKKIFFSHFSSLISSSSVFLYWKGNLSSTWVSSWDINGGSKCALTFSLWWPRCAQHLWSCCTYPYTIFSTHLCDHSLSLKSPFPCHIHIALFLLH